MLSRSEAIRLLILHGKGAAWTKHCFAVADSALRLGQVLENRMAIDRPFLWTAALLHDIGRCITHDPIRHGVEGYRLLSGLGHEAEAYVCASHILFGLDAAEAAAFGLPEQGFFPRTLEERLVPLIDFMMEGDQPTSLNRRFASLRRRNAGNCFFMDRLDRAYETAKLFKKQLSDEIGESFDDFLVCHEHAANGIFPMF